MVECGGLENRYVGNPGVGGSNPPLSAKGTSSLTFLVPESAGLLPPEAYGTGLWFGFVSWCLEVLAAGALSPGRVG